ncbi:hypothetical protein J3A83DRAFT_3239360 [Scleroderma citrinum]
MIAQTQTYTHADDLPAPVWDAFRHNEAAANVVYPFALKARESPRGSQEQLWIAYFDSTDQVTFVLSCTTRSLGDYPVFIYTTNGPAERQPADITEPLESLATALRRSVNPARVFAVFACEAVTREFARIWEVLSEIKVEGPYYDATFTFCTKTTLTPSMNLRPLPEDRNLTIWLGQAEDSHLAWVANLCQQFAATSEPYTLDTDSALKEAKVLIKGREVWIHLIQEGENGEWDVASIVAASRRSENVAAVTKVYTNPRWRQLGCAERLLRRVCKELLLEKERVVLYVGVDNNAAGVYRRVGFQGLGGSGEVEGVEKWLELGFDKQRVNLGYW